MYKVLLADDEFFSREALKQTIPWDEYGCEVCGEAKNGKEGIEKALELRPDIVLTDINMPVMDGLDMVMNLKEALPDTLFAIITGYSEFEYAKRGIELGVEDFILKPIDDREVVRTILHMTEILDERGRRTQEYQSLKFWAERNTDENRKNFLAMLLMGDKGITESQFLFECGQLGLGMERGGYIVCYLYIDSRTYVRFSQREWQDVVSAAMGDESGKWDYTVCYKGNGNLYIIFSGLPETDWLETALSSLMQKIQIYLIRKWVCTIQVGVGAYSREWTGISASRADAEASVHDISASKLITDTLHYIYEHYADPDLSVKRIAEHLFVNYSYLSAQFTKEVGMSASQYISRFRMTKAADALRSGRENMVEIACASGYTDVKYFYRCFKKEFGITPYQYIEILKDTKEKKDEF